MPEGLEINDANGVKVFDIIASASGAFGSFSTGGQQTGTYTDASLINRRLSHFVAQNSSEYGGPKVTLNSATGVITWAYEMTLIGGANAPAIPSETIFYGGY